MVQYTNDLVEIEADDKGSLLSAESSLSEDDEDIPELEDQSNQENQVVLPVLPPYVVSGQCAVCSKGFPKSTFHPYPSNCHPLGKIYERPGIGFYRS